MATPRLVVGGVTRWETVGATYARPTGLQRRAPRRQRVVIWWSNWRPGKSSFAVDLEFDEVAAFEDAGLGIRAAGADQALMSSSHGIEVFDRDHDLVRTRDALWADAAADGLLLGEIDQDPAAEPLRAAQQVAASDPAPSEPDRSPAGTAPSAGATDASVPWLAVAGLVLAALAAVAVIRLRPGRRSAE